MKKQILKTIVTVGLLYSSNILADTPLAPTEQEFQEIVDSFKLIDTTYNVLSKTYKIDGDIVKGELEKQDDTKDSQYAQHIIILNNKKLYEPNYWHSIYIYDQKLLSVACMAPNKEKVVASVSRSSYYYKQKKQKLVNYAVFVASFTKDTTLGNYEISGLFDEKHSAGWETSIPTYNPNEFFPYFNEPRILARLYETGICDKEATQKANIEVLVGDKWIQQEESWKVLKDDNLNTKETLTLNQLFENAKTNKKVSFDDIEEVTKIQGIYTKNVQKYNDIAYYLQQSGANAEAFFLLEKIIEKFPNRTVAYLNLADAYNGYIDKQTSNQIYYRQKAKQNYEKYISLMKQDGKESKIPQRVLEFK